jgi:ADP-ribosylglycohydrolase
MLAELQLDALRALLRDEISLKREQGFSVEAWERALRSADYEALLELEAELESAQEPEEFAASEPLDWTIPDLGCRPWEPCDEELKDRLAGALYGRIAGCVLGKPVEIGPVFEGYAKLHEYLRRTGQYDLPGFIRNDEAIALEVFGEPIGCPKCWAQNVAFAESDDDLRYTFMGIDLLSKLGKQVRTSDVLDWWSENLVPEMSWTAEQAAIANSYRIGPHSGDRRRWTEDQWAFIRRYRNPYREFIGAAIRADGWAYGAAGNPQQAATFAQQDARLSHERNGEYSEIFFAAWIAGSFRMPAEDAMELALGTIPRGARLTQAIRFTQDLCSRERSFEGVCERVHSEFGRYHPVHAINNAAACVAAVMLSDGEYERGITSAVKFAWDTDCNGATVGSILGAQLGLSRLPSSWISPLNDRIELGVGRHQDLKISELVERTVLVWKSINSKV